MTCLFSWRFLQLHYQWSCWTQAQLSRPSQLSALLTFNCVHPCHLSSLSFSPWTRHLPSPGSSTIRPEPRAFRYPKPPWHKAVISRFRLFFNIWFQKLSELYHCFDHFFLEEKSINQLSWAMLQWLGKRMAIAYPAYIKTGDILQY